MLACDVHVVCFAPVGLCLLDDLVFLATDLEPAFACHDDLCHTLMMTEPRPVFDFAVEGPVQAEVFVVYLDGGAIRITGPCGPEAWLIELGPDDDPVEVVTRLTRANVGEPTVVHSTSWRRDRHAVILSFVVVIPPSTVGGMSSADVTRADLARSHATAAPDDIAANQVLEHGLRHLAWLVRDDDVVKHELADGWPEALSGYVPEPFQHLP